MIAAALRSACAQHVASLGSPRDVYALRAAAHQRLVAARRARGTVAIVVVGALGYRRSHMARIDWPALPGEAVSTAWGLA